MKTIETKREELKNQRVKVCFMAKKHCLDIEESMQFIKVDDLADIEVSLIWSDLKIWGIENGIIMTNERNSKLDWWI
jgi:hypothetical protein